MRSRMRRRIVAFAVAAASALTIAATTAATASALVRGHAAATMHFGRGGTFAQFTPPAFSLGSFIGGLAISAAVIAIVAWLALRSDRRSRARLALAPTGPANAERAPLSNEDHERKAA
jgi:apolipoprotein N-acyltransferase